MCVQFYKSYWIQQRTDLVPTQISGGMTKNHFLELNIRPIVARGTSRQEVSTQCVRSFKIPE